MRTPPARIGIRRATRLVPVLAGLCVLASVAHGSLMVAPPPYRPKDFTMVKKDGIFHLFYIRRDVTVPMEQTENDLGHSISDDLYSWAHLPNVLPVRPDGWDNQHVWAPHIVEIDSVYYMLYTGVSDSLGLWNRWQRTGLATSTDLMNWNRLDAPVFSCQDVPWSWCDSTNASTGFRDPFVMPDPSMPGRWLMYTSTFPDADHGGMIVGVGTSMGDFTEWTDLKPLWITNRAYSFNSIVESPHLFKHGNLWYLFFTTNAGQPISYATSPNPVGEPNEWSYKGRLATMLGQDTQTWIASEYFKNGTHEYFMFVNYNRIEIYEIGWNANGTFLLYEPGPFHVSEMGWSADSVTAGDSTSLRLIATAFYSQNVTLEALEVLPGGAQIPVSLDSLGLPTTITIQDDTTDVPWAARIRHASGDTATAMTLIVRLADQTAQAAPLVITPPPFEVTALTWSADPVTAGQPETLSVVARSWTGQSASLEGVEVLAGGGEVPVSLDSLGLPATVPLSADTTRVPWTARIRHASGDSLTTMTLVVRTTDLAAASPPLTLVPPLFEPQAMAWSTDSTGAGDVVTLSIAASGWGGQSLAIEAFEVLPWETELPLSLDSLGMPAAVMLDADTTRLSWIARIHHASGDTSSAITIVLRARDYPLATDWLRIEPVPFAVRELEWSADSVVTGVRETLMVVARAWSGQTALLEGVELLPGGGEAPVPLDSLGLPDSLTIEADTTRIPWVARIRHASGDTTGSMVLLVRTMDQSTAADPLHLEPPPPPLAVPEPGAGRFALRSLARTPFGSQPALLVTMPREAPVRIDLHDLQGRRIRNLVDRRLPVGATVLTWDGRDDQGASVSSGVYFARALSPLGTRTARLFVTR